MPVVWRVTGRLDCLWGGELLWGGPWGGCGGCVGDGGWVLYYTEVLLIVIPNFWDSPMIV